MEAHTTGQTIWSVSGRDYAEEEKGEKEIAYSCQPRFFMQGFFSGIKNHDLIMEIDIMGADMRSHIKANYGRHDLL